jgi:hypothetical protein
MVRKNKQVRDYLYIHTSEDPASFVICGMQFKEFIEAYGNGFDLLLLRPEFWPGHYHLKSRFQYVKSLEIFNLLEENIYRFGDFHTTDMPNYQLLDSIPDFEIAELLYLSHIGKPLNTTFSSHLQNTFFYHAHDDGFFTRLFLKSPEIMKILVGKIIISKIKDLFNRKLPNLDLSLLDIIEQKSKQGLFIELSEIEKTNSIFEFSIYLPPQEFSPYSNTSNIGIDEFFNKIEKYKGLSKKRKIVLRKRQWSLE